MSNSPSDALRGNVGNMTMPSTQQVYSQTLSLLLGTAISLDFKSTQYRNQLENIQGIFADNSAGTTTLSILSTATNTTFKIPPGSQGVMPLYVTADLTLVISGAGQVPITLLNFPTPAAVWSATSGSGGFVFDGNYLLTEDKNIAAHTEAGGIQTMQRVLGNADAPKYLRQGNWVHQSISATGNTVLIAGAPTWFMTSLRVSVSPAVSLAVAGFLSVNVSGSTSGIIATGVVGLGAAPVAIGISQTLIDLKGVDFVGNPAGENLIINFSAALNTGAIDVTVGGGTTAGI